MITRRGKLGEDEYNRRYEGLEHLHFSRPWFANELDGENLSVWTEDQCITDYAHARFRSNVFAVKP